MLIDTYCLTSKGIFPFDLPGLSPDEITRNLPRGIFTTFSTNHIGTRVLGFSNHLDRIYTKVDAESAIPSATRENLRMALAKLSISIAPAESRFRIQVSLADGRIFIIHQKFNPPPGIVYEKGVKTITANFIRDDPRKKDSNFIERSWAERKLVGNQIFEVLLTKNGHIYEGMTSNFYVIKNEILVTARTGILPGITRHVVLQLAHKLGIARRYCAPRIGESFVEAFISSSSRGIVPVVSIDGRRVGKGGVGTWTRQLISAYREYVKKYSELIAPHE